MLPQRQGQATVISANAPGSPTEVTVVYSAAMDPASATATANYGLAPTYGGAAISVTGAVLSPDQTTVQLKLGASLVLGTNYTLTIRNVKDASGAALASPTVLEGT